MPRQKPTSPALTDDPSIQATRIPPPPLSFNDTPQSLEHLVASQPLPCVIQCVNVPGSGKNVFQSNFDIKQPLLAYRTRRVRKVSAYSLSFDNQRHEFVTIGNGILIPEDYPGWFAVMGTPNTEINLTSVSHYTKLSLLATSKCSHFLIGGKEPIRGVMVQNDENGKLKTTECSILPGTVLRKAGLYREDKPATKEKHKKKKDKDVPQREFLKCFDEHDREMLVHTRQTGAFYIVARDQTTVSPSVLQMKDILRYKFPLIVKLIYGRVPTTPCAFTQVLLLTDHGVSSTLIASTLKCFRNINLEIPLRTGLKFFVARNSVKLLNSEAYIRALETCKEQAPCYVKDMKVVFGNSQLESDEVARLTTKTNQTENLTPIIQALPGCKQPVSTPKSPVQEHPRPCSVRITSILPDLSCHVVTSPETFVLTDFPSSPQTKTPRKGGTPPVSPDCKMSPLNVYVPPQHPVITGPGLHPPQAASRTRPRLSPVYDNNSPTCLYTSNRPVGTPGNQSEPTSNPPPSCSPPSCSPSSCSPSGPVSGMSNQDHSTIYLHAWDDEIMSASKEDKRASTIPIPSKSGKPVSPGKFPVDDVNQIYISMLKTAEPVPKPHLWSAGQHNKATLHSPSEVPQLPPPIPPRDRIGYNHSESSSVNDSDSFTTLSEDSWSLSDWTTDDEGIYENMKLTDLKRVENYISENTDLDQKLTSFEDGSPPYLELENMLDPSVPYSQLQSSSQMDLTSEFCGYLEPLDVYFQQSREEETGEHTADPGYSRPDKQSDSGVYMDGPGYSRPDKQPDSRVYVDEPGYSRPDRQQDNSVYVDERGYSMARESLDPSDRHQSIVPQLPPALPPRMTLGQAVLRSVSTPSKFAFTQFHKEMLLLELRKSGIKPHSEMALVGLELADITNLLSKDDDFDDDLFALLPQLKDTIDLKKIAVCLREMKFRK